MTKPQDPNTIPDYMFLIHLVIRQAESDIYERDLDGLIKLLELVPEKDLRAYLPEDKRPKGSLLDLGRES